MSRTHILKRDVDERIDKQKICHRCGNSLKQAHPLCNAIYRPAGSIERDTMSLYYLKPAQMDLLTNGPSQLGIEGPAGTGKSFVLLLKIMYLIKAESKHDIILLAP